jgi:hypothetical protein
MRCAQKHRFAFSWMWFLLLASTFFFFVVLLSASWVGLPVSRPHQRARPQFRSHTSRTFASI